jgi:hypothetical protein
MCRIAVRNSQANAWSDGKAEWRLRTCNAEWLTLTHPPPVVLTGAETIINNGFSYDPSTRGPITSISASVDKNLGVNIQGSGFGNTFRPTARAAVCTEPSLTRSERISELAVSIPHLRQADVELIVGTYSGRSPTLWLAAQGTARPAQSRRDAAPHLAGGCSTLPARAS